MPRYARITAAILALTMLALVSVEAVAEAPDDAARRWSQSIWEAAMDSKRGDLDQMRRFFDSMPTLSFDEELLAHFKASDLRDRTNEATSIEERDADRATALEEMRTHLEERDIYEALLSVVKVQTLSDDLDDVFAYDEVGQILTWAKEEIARAEEANDWLELQELVFRMRTIFEDTDRQDEHQIYYDELKVVSRRVGMLARYAPRHLHKFRAKRAERLGEDDPGPFNEDRADDWKERLEGITPKMLKNSLRKAAVEHIEAEHWLPLLAGGLDAMRIFATTPALSETFPNLNDQEKVQRFLDVVRNEMATVHRTNPEELNSWTLSAVLDDVVVANEQTLKLPRALIYREFGDGAMYELDRFSEIMWPDKLRRFEQSTQGNFIGVGIIIRETDTNEILIVNPLEGSPAYFGGIKPDDLLKQVNGESTVGWTLNDAVDKITGKANTQVRLGVKRDGEDDIIDVPLTRKTIKLRSVYGWWKEDLSPTGEPEWDWFIDPATRVAYIKLTQFTEDTYTDLLTAWHEINDAGGANGIILDLRFNPGGLLISAVQISNLFVKSGMIVGGVDKHGEQSFPEQHASGRRAQLAGVPTVVLINNGSASASEIVAGCLQAHNAAVIVGDRTYGKGSVQTVHQTDRNAQLKLTTQYYQLPPNTRDGQTKPQVVHKRPRATVWGVDPDILVPMTPSQYEKSYELRQAADLIPEDENGLPDPNAGERPDVTGLLTKGIDPQLEAALLLLQARIIGELDEVARHASIR